ncbi:MAG: hypothetical protein FWH57_05315 [Oscillospiraceae bacterium]|nr:hypothetical protein [Oscillospiraceae bacterium]
MSTKRMLGVTLFGLLIIIVFAGIMLLNLYLGSESEAIALPERQAPVTTPITIESDDLDRVEVTKETIQAVVSALSRPRVYSRDVKIACYWDGGRAEYSVSVSVMERFVSLTTLPSVGAEKRIIITPDTLYIWYKGENRPYIGNLESSGDGYRTADEWQMLVTYEDLLKLDKSDIIDAGYIDYNGEYCVYAVYRSPLLNNVGTIYISLDLGLVVGAEERDEAGELIYSMSSDECLIGEADPAAFILPDGANVLDT